MLIRQYFCKAELGSNQGLIECMYVEEGEGQHTLYMYRPRTFVVKYTCTVQPRLSGLHLSGPSIIQTSWRPENTLPYMCRRGIQ